MLPRPSRFAVIAFLFVSPLLNTVHAQSRASALFRPSTDDARSCAEFPTFRSANAGARLSFLDSLSSCLEAPPRADALSAPAEDIRHAISGSRLSPDPVVAELLSLGKPGHEIAEARAAVLAILDDNNACSAWFREKEPDAVVMFRTLHMVLDRQDPGMVRKTGDSNQGWIYRQPYVARAQQNVGPGSNITLNQRGAFFQDATGVIARLEEAGPDIIEPARMLRVGDYRGGTRQARILTILHEFGHVIDLLPLDAGVPSGPDISMRNTQLVVQHCKPELEAVARKRPASSPHAGTIASLQSSFRP